MSKRHHIFPTQLSHRRIRRGGSSFRARVAPQVMLWGALLFTLGACGGTNDKVAPAPTESSSATPPASADIWEAIESDDPSAVREAISAGADIESRDSARQTPLIAATKANQVDVATALLEAGADPNAQDDMRDSAFLYAGAEGHDEILRVALENGADVTSTNRFGGTALIPASEKGHIATVETLIAAEVPVDHINDLGWTALHEAIVLGDGSDTYVTIVGLLLEAGADPTIADAQGVAPRQLARDAGYHDLVAEIDRHL